MSQERAEHSATTQEQWITQWRRSLDVILEKAMQLRDDRDVYNEYHRIVLGSPGLKKSNEFLVLVQDMYLKPHTCGGAQV